MIAPVSLILWFWICDFYFQAPPSFLSSWKRKIGLIRKGGYTAYLPRTNISLPKVSLTLLQAHIFSQMDKYNSSTKSPGELDLRNRNDIHCYCTFFCFWPCHAACGILVPQPGIEPMPPAVEVQSPNHWTAREFPAVLLITVQKAFGLTMWAVFGWLNHSHESLPIVNLWKGPSSPLILILSHQRFFKRGFHPRGKSKDP